MKRIDLINSNLTEPVGLEYHNPNLIYDRLSEKKQIFLQQYHLKQILHILFFESN